MALPKLNQAPSYELTIPSTQEKIKFRPFLVKEQKILLMAMETQDEKQMLQAVLDTLAVCIVDEYNINKLKSYDVEYIFLQLRTKSVGESTKLTFKCTECESDNEVTIPINEVNIIFSEDNVDSIDIGGLYNLKLQYPEFNSIVNMERIKDETEAQILFKTAAMCMHTLETEEEQIAFVDETPQAIDEFMESLTSEQFNTIMEFAQNMPTIKYDGNFKCAKCQHDNTYNIKGMQDFF
jgi:DNA-directed RNA polymerase subunit M/transcription elongation factor TFIIS